MRTITGMGTGFSLLFETAGGTQKMEARDSSKLEGGHESQGL
ncbi:hypothetical protein A33Q_3927 [Indibacter alkaliphilus LW1]|uniref:Uncharacterized protein n=1 Tax=Indibacter alkaliphilus (strain CCUG 57479 / KCTC 22604 / LW1) TaxID=1189612 RepID=S2DLK3_INDAL|nr:hypothetical protein [Indibacter alkaliphilus]EOZ92836.1 hypothetical protein A33Q_3927 [Indibacter alkaliphilus LW1]